MGTATVSSAEKKNVERSDQAGRKGEEDKRKAVAARNSHGHSNLSLASLPPPVQDLISVLSGSPRSGLYWAFVAWKRGKFKRFRRNSDRLKNFTRGMMYNVRTQWNGADIYFDGVSRDFTRILLVRDRFDKAAKIAAAAYAAAFFNTFHVPHFPKVGIFDLSQSKLFIYDTPSWQLQDYWIEFRKKMEQKRVEGRIMSDRDKEED